MRASIDLYYHNLCWRQINELRCIKIKISNTQKSTDAAVMPLEEFESYLLFKTNGSTSEEFYLHNIEGEKYSIYSTRYERDPVLRSLAIELHGTKCQVCEFSFEKKYGDIGKDYIEVHHIRPLSQGIREVDPENDLVCLCSNCHRMIHR